MGWCVRVEERLSATLVGRPVNTLVLVNNSKQPLLLLAGEIVTSGEQGPGSSRRTGLCRRGRSRSTCRYSALTSGGGREASAKFGTSAKASMKALWCSRRCGGRRSWRKEPAAGVELGASSDFDDGNGDGCSFDPGWKFGTDRD